MSTGRHRAQGRRRGLLLAGLLGVAALPVGLLSCLVTAQLAGLGFIPGWLT